MKSSLPEHKVIRKYLRNERLYSPSKLTNIRKQRNISREDVVKETGISYHTIDKLENGKVKSPELNTLIIFAELYNCCISEFLINPKLSYFHCSQIEQKLIQNLREYPEFNISKIVKILADQSDHGKIVRQNINDILSLPDNILENYHLMSKDIIKILTAQNQNKDNDNGIKKQLDLIKK